ncbi:MAG: protein-L-isoaspartate(D-aspartate) O-methyltransferase [Planctomycetaceae bacterium]|nr:protein-L-isoaspartate(D-aspartate) O-methyltransferase [Planctomycetaceae bacterium]
MFISQTDRTAPEAATRHSCVSLRLLERHQVASGLRPPSVPGHKPQRSPILTRQRNLVATLIWAIIGSAQTLIGPPAAAQSTDRFTELRHRMVTDVIEKEGITNPLVLKAMKAVPRHEFVPGNLRSRAYEDAALAIGSQQTISPPYIVAYMTATIDPQPENKVLEIGTGSGYQAAVLANIVKEVYSIEIVPSLAKSSAARLEKLGYKNVFTKEGDGYAGWAEHAPFDRIIVTCSPENVPRALVDQLSEGGLMIIPLGERYQQSFYLLRKEGGSLRQEKLVPTLFVPMTGQSESERRIQPDPDHPAIVNGDFELDENDDTKVDGWHYQRNSEICTESPMSGSRCLRFTNQDPGELAQGLQGCAVNGRRIGGLDVAVWARTNGIVPGHAPDEVAAVVVHFFDSVRRGIGTIVVSQWRGTENWQQARKRIPVPPATREIVIRIGLNGATGTLDLDNLQIAGVPR